MFQYCLEYTDRIEHGPSKSTRSPVKLMTSRNLSPLAGTIEALTYSGQGGEQNRQLVR